MTVFVFNKSKPIAIIGLLLFSLIGCSQVDVNPQETSDSSINYVDLYSTNQYQEAFKEYGDLIPYTELNNFKHEEVVIGASLAGEYVEEGIYNPYFISGYWKKDNFTLQAIQPLQAIMTEQYGDIFAEDLISSAKSSDKTLFNSLIYNPDIDGFRIHEDCYNNWQEGICYIEKKPIKISNIIEVNGKLEIAVSVQIETLYDSEDGTVIQPRTYDLKFIVVKNILPTSIETKSPILTIDDVQGSLVIGDNIKLFEQGVDYE